MQSYRSIGVLHVAEIHWEYLEQVWFVPSVHVTAIYSGRYNVVPQFHIGNMKGCWAVIFDLRPKEEHAPEFGHFLLQTFKGTKNNDILLTSINSLIESK